MTLLEVTIATLMLGIGLVAVASLFPVAGTIQRKTYDEMMVRQAADSAQDAIQARGFNTVDLIPSSNPMLLLDFNVHPVPANILDSTDQTTPTVTRWGLADRCFPSAMGGDPDCSNRSYYWVPLVRQVNLLDYQIIVFILKKEPGVTYGSHANAANPKDAAEIPAVASVAAAPISGGKLLVANAANYFQPGDPVADSRGVVHTVTDVDGLSVTVSGYVDPLVGSLWYSPRLAGGECPARRILVFGNGVVLK